PNTSEATKIGEPTLVDPTPMSASQVVQRATRVAMGGDSQSVSVETVKSGTPGPDQPAPRSDSPAAADAAVAVDATGTPDTAASPPAAQPNPNELKPNSGPADPNELKPNVS